MATADQVVVELRAKVDQYNANLLKAQRNFENSTSRMTRAARDMQMRVQSSFASTGASISRAFAVAGGVRGLQLLIDSATRVDNALKVAGLSGAELENVYRRLQQSAQKNAAPLETLVTLYGRAALVQKELNVSQEEMLNFTDKIAVALRVSGQSAAESSGALLQLSQALGSGVVRAEEFNSILEGALPIAQAAAAGLKEAGGSVARLRQLVVDGKVSSEAFFRAFEAGASILDEKVEGAVLTTSQGFTLLSNSLVDATRDFLKGSSSAESLGNAFEIMSGKINSVDFSEFGKQVSELLKLVGQIQGAMEWVQNFGGKLGSATGLDAVGDYLTGGQAYGSYLGGAITVTNQRGLQRRIDDAFAGIVETTENETVSLIQKSAAATAEKQGRIPQSSSTVTPVSLDDFSSPSAQKSGRGGRGGSRRDYYQNEVRSIQERTEALTAETAAMATLNPLMNDYSHAVEKARAAQELLSAAKRQGLEITPELISSIDILAERYAGASSAAAMLAESQENLKKQASELNEVAKSSLGSFIQDMLDGKSAADALANSLKNIGNKLIDMGLNSLFGGGGAGGGLFGALFGGFRANGGPVQAGRAYVVGERRPEVFVPNQAGSIIPRVPNMAGAGGGPGITVDAKTTIDARGADPSAIARLEAAVARRDAELPSRIISEVRKAQKTNVKL